MSISVSKSGVLQSLPQIPILSVQSLNILLGGGEKKGNQMKKTLRTTTTTFFSIVSSLGIPMKSEPETWISNH